MKTSREFDYDIWKDDEGHYCVRVKRTGETVRVSKEVVRELWMELYRMRKHQQDNMIADEDGILHSRVRSLDDDSDPSGRVHRLTHEPWLMDCADPYAALEWKLLESDFLATLSEKQRTVYRLYFQTGLTAAECAAHTGTSVRNVEKLISLIRKKAKNFF